MQRGWLLGQAKRKRFRMELLEQAGSVGHRADAPASCASGFGGG